MSLADPEQAQCRFPVGEVAHRPHECEPRGAEGERREGGCRHEPPEGSGREKGAGG